MARLRGGTHVVWGLFFLTGFSGLLYEVLWTRQLTVVFGNTVAATSTVLAAYMGGLALGSYLIGRLADRVRKPLLLYGVLEALVAASALLFPVILRLSIPLLQGLYRSGHTGTLGAVRFLIAFLFLFIPTAAMGGSLPALGKLLARIEDAGRTLSFLYGVNTLGATLGTFCAGFWIIPSFGLSGALAVAVALNVTVAAAAALLSIWTPQAPLEEAAQPRQTPVEAGDRFLFRITLMAFLVSGALALALEVVWTRSLLLVFGSTVYSFTVMLGVFLTGLAAGSALFGLFVNRLEKPLWALGLVEAGIGLVTLVSIARVNGLPSAFLDGLIAHGFSWDSYTVQKLLIASGVLFPVSFLFGATFPLVARTAVSRQEHLGGQVGTLYAFNTVGAIAGSLLAGFILLPTLGLQRSLTLIALCALALGVVLLLIRQRDVVLWPRLAAAALAALLGIGGALAIPKWDEKILSAGVYFRPATYLSPDNKHNRIEQALGDLSVLEYIEGVTETAAVVKTPYGRMFLVDGKVEAATDLVDMRLQRLMGHLPMLFAPRLGKGINIGLGCGITLGSVKVYPVEALQCVELERDILKTARFFAEQNHDVLDDKRLHIILNDGRNHLLLTDQRYDVITSDPFEPLVGGAASLYTENHFKNGRARLTPGGIFCQYLPMYQLSPDDYRMIIRSFCRVFPHASLWYTGIDTVLLGSVEPHATDLATLRERMALPTVKESLAGIGITGPEQLLQTFVCDPGQLPEITGPGPVNTDTKPFIEFSAPRSHLANTTPKNLRWLIASYRPEDLPLKTGDPSAAEVASKAREVGRRVMEASLDRFEGRFDKGLALAREARALDPANEAVLFEVAVSANSLAEQLIRAGKLQEAKALLDEALATGQLPLLINGTLATLAFNANEPEAARYFIQKCLDINPDLAETTLKMALCLQNLGKPAEAATWCDKALALNPNFTQAQLVRADLALDLGDRQDALKRYQAILRVRNAEVTGQDWLTYGLLLAENGRRLEARDAMLKAVALSPDLAPAWYNLARLEKLQGNSAQSAEALEKARKLAPALVEQWLAGDNVLAGP